MATPHNGQTRQVGKDSTCTSGAPVESAAHVMLCCPTLSNAITAAHDSVLASIRQALEDHCPCFTQHWCTAAGSLCPSLTAEFPTLTSHLDGPRFVHLERQVPDAVFVHEDGTCIAILELARTDDLVEGYWRDRSAAKVEKYRPFREAIASITGAKVRPPLSLCFRGSLCESEWRAQLKPFALFPTVFTELRRSPVAVRLNRPGQYGESGTRPWANHKWRQER